MVRISSVGVLAPHRQLRSPEMRIAFDRAALEFTEGQRANADLAGSHYNLANFPSMRRKLGKPKQSICKLSNSTLLFSRLALTWV